MKHSKDSTSDGNQVEVFPAEKALLLDHNYDGILELDHMLPRWWVWLLYSTIIFSVGYVGYYMVGPGPTPEQELEVEMNRIAALQPAPGSGSVLDSSALVAALGDVARIQRGKIVYDGKCLACHGDLGQGTIGPNLTDEFWIHGGAPQDIAMIIANGVAEKGMPPWGPLLSTEEMTDLVVFVDSLRGTSPSGAKAPEGEKYEVRN